MKKQVLQNWLRFLASKILLKYKPRIVAITGSTGKTSTKDAVFAVLEDSDIENGSKVGRTRGNLNTEFGVTASIIDPSFVGTEAGDKMRLSIGDVVRLSLRAWRLIWVRSSYPQILVLELAADKPGDISYFMRFISPEIGILTNIGDVHLEFFGSKASLVEEKGRLIAGVIPQGIAILNKDDEFSNLISKKTSAKKIFISTKNKNEADFRASNIITSGKGIRFTLSYLNRSIEVAMPVYGQQFVYAALFAFAVADYFGISFEQTAHRLINFESAPGRFERIDLNNLILIDDTYNANPTSTIAALQSLAQLGQQQRKVAILGDMRELGEAYEKGHRQVGQMVAQTVDLLIVVGEGGKLIRHFAIEAGLPQEQTVILAEIASQTISAHLRNNDIVLVKGSRAVNMDGIVDLIKQKFNHG